MDLAQKAARMEDLANRISEWLERHQAGFLAGFTVVYFLATIAWAKSERFWFDELFTYYVALQPTLRDLWAALTAPIDQQPLFFFLVTRGASHLTSDPYVGLRLPGMFGFWLLNMCVFFYTSRRSTALWGLVAMLALYLTPAFYYAHEARPYGLAVGFAALALLCWQNAAAGIWRATSLVGLAFGVAAAISSSFYAALIVAPLALGEITRSLSKRSIDFGVWVALTCGAGVGLLYLPLVAGYVHSFPARNWASPTTRTIFDLYANLLDKTVLAAVLVLLAAGIQWMRPAPPPGHGHANARRPLIYEVVAAAGFLLLPCLGYLAAVSVTKMIAFRYVLSTVIGFSILAAWTLYGRTRSSAVWGIALVCILAASAAADQVMAFRNEIPSRLSETTRLRTLLSGQPDTLPVVVDDPIRSLELFHYERSDVTSRLYYLIDPAASLRFGATPYEEGTDWLLMNRFMPVRAEMEEPFRRRTKRFLLYTTGSPLGFVLAQLTAEGADIHLLAGRGGESLYLISDIP